MINIVLLSTLGGTTSFLVDSMKRYAEEISFKCKINVYPVSEINAVKKQADIILLGPQGRFNLKKINKITPLVPVKLIEKDVYEKVDGKTIIDSIRLNLKT